LPGLFGTAKVAYCIDAGSVRAGRHVMGEKGNAVADAGVGVGDVAGGIASEASAAGKAVAIGVGTSMATDKAKEKLSNDDEGENSATS
jgi:ubiquinone/menaquinone biosynthesis C-methylase UbiE